MCQDFTQEGVVSACPSTLLPELKDHPFSGIHGHLFTIRAAAFPSGSCLFYGDLKKSRAVMTWGPRTTDHKNPNSWRFLTNQRSCYWF